MQLYSGESASLVPFIVLYGVPGIRQFGIDSYSIQAALKIGNINNPLETFPTYDMFFPSLCLSGKLSSDMWRSDSRSY